MIHPAIGAAGHGSTIYSPFKRTTSTGATKSFSQQLVSAGRTIPVQASESSHLRVNIPPAPGQNSDNRQSIVTAKHPAIHPPAGSPVSVKTASLPTTPPSAPPAPSTPSTPPAASGRFLMDLSTPTKPGVKPAPAAPIVTPSDAYWAQQPPAVQVLRNTPEDQRLGVAQQLAQQGYTIDVPIMVWGWDPLVTMTVRQNMGYTWVPSALQKPVSVVPGVNFPGSLSYDPNNAPVGSIQVTTDFAKYANSPDPWIKS